MCLLAVLVREVAGPLPTWGSHAQSSDGAEGLRGQGFESMLLRAVWRMSCRLAMLAEGRACAQVPGVHQPGQDRHGDMSRVLDTYG